MRTINFFIIYIFLSNLSFGQDSSQTKLRNTIVKMDLVFPALWIATPVFSNMVSIAVENSTFKNQSIQLRSAYSTITQEQIDQYSLYGTNFSTKTTVILKTLQIIPEYRFYVTKKNLYLGPYLKHSYNQTETTIIPNDTIVQVLDGFSKLVWNTLGIGGLAGYQFFIKNRISVDFLLALGIRKIIYQKNIIGEGDVKASLADGIFSVTVGYRFIHKK